MTCEKPTEVTSSKWIIGQFKPLYMCWHHNWRLLKNQYSTTCVIDLMELEQISAAIDCFSFLSVEQVLRMKFRRLFKFLQVQINTVEVGMYWYSQKVSNCLSQVFSIVSRNHNQSHELSRTLVPCFLYINDLLRHAAPTMFAHDVFTKSAFDTSSNLLLAMPKWRSCLFVLKKKTLKSLILHKSLNGLAPEYLQCLSTCTQRHVKVELW